MARGRMISNTLGESRKYASLSTDIARVLYPLIVASTDKGGRIEADPIYITRKVCTRLPYDHAQVEDALKDMANVGLIILYEHAGVPYLQVVKFRAHNTPHHKEPDSEIAPPPGYDWDGNEIEAARKPDQDDTPDDGSKHDASTKARTSQARREKDSKQAHKGSKGKEREVEGKGREARATPTPQDHPTSEEAFHQAATTGLDPTILEHKVRERIRRTAGKDFQLEHDHDIPRWSREHPPDRIDELWEAAKPEHWRGTPKADKRRVWIFEDLLNQDVQPPAEADDPLRQYVELGL